MAWAVLDMWYSQPHHLCCLVNVGLIRLWGIPLQSLSLQHIKTNCELQQVLHRESVTQNSLFKNTAFAVMLSKHNPYTGSRYMVSCQVNLNVQVVWDRWTSQEFLHFGSLMEKRHQRENWDCRPLGRIYLQALAWVEDSPRYQIPLELSLTELADTWLAGLCSPWCTLWAFYSKFLPSLPSTLTSRRAHAFVLQWAKHLAPSICLHRHFSIAQGQGLSQWREGKYQERSGSVLVNTLVFSSCRAAIQRDQLISEAQILFRYNAT